MLWMVHRVLMDFQGWLGGCDCHDCFDSMKRADLKEFAELQEHVGIDDRQWDGVRFKRPLVGLRAPELASGAWKRIMEVMFTTGLDKLIEIMAADPGTFLDGIVGDFEKGKRYPWLLSVGRINAHQEWLKQCQVSSGKSG